jgi:phosphohistidine swiveling domain-containing protein
MAKIDGTGYAIVLRSVDNPNIWEAATSVEKLKEGDTVSVDNAKGVIFYNNKVEGDLIRK